MARLWRAYHPDLQPSPGTRLILDGDEAHHVVRVLRLQPGERLSVFDGRGNEWQATVAGAEGRKVEVILECPVMDPIEAVFQLRLFQGLCKTDRMEWVIQKATELGVVAIHALETTRSDGRVPDERRLERWRRIVIEACKQSGRRSLPSIESSAGLPDAAPDTPAFVLDPLSKVPMGECVNGLDRPGGAWMAIGPESGFAAEELQDAEDRGWRRVGLGPRILRTETAGLVAASILLHRWADLGP